MYNNMVITYIGLFYIYRSRLVSIKKYIVTYILSYSHRYMCYMHDAHYDNNIINYSRNTCFTFGENISSLYASSILLIQILQIIYIGMSSIILSIARYSDGI